MTLKEIKRKYRGYKIIIKNKNIDKNNIKEYGSFGVRYKNPIKNIISILFKKNGIVNIYL